MSGQNNEDNTAKSKEKAEENRQKAIKDARDHFPLLQHAIPVGSEAPTSKIFKQAGGLSFPRDLALSGADIAAGGVLYFGHVVLGPTATAIAGSRLFGRWLGRSGSYVAQGVMSRLPESFRGTPARITADDIDAAIGGSNSGLVWTRIAAHGVAVAALGGVLVLPFVLVAAPVFPFVANYAASAVAGAVATDALAEAAMERSPLPQHVNRTFFDHPSWGLGSTRLSQLVGTTWEPCVKIVNDPFNTLKEEVESLKKEADKSKSMKLCLTKYMTEYVNECYTRFDLGAVRGTGDTPPSHIRYKSGLWEQCLYDMFSVCFLPVATAAACAASACFVRVAARKSNTYPKTLFSGKAADLETEIPTIVNNTAALVDAAHSVYGTLLSQFALVVKSTDPLESTSKVTREVDTCQKLLTAAAAMVCYIGSVCERVEGLFESNGPTSKDGKDARKTLKDKTKALMDDFTKTPARKFKMEEEKPFELNTTTATVEPLMGTWTLERHRKFALAPKVLPRVDLPYEWAPATNDTTAPSNWWEDAVDAYAEKKDTMVRMFTVETTPQKDSSSAE